jgi:poly(hydroxyalkanoate) granule-associated protein
MTDTIKAETPPEAAAVGDADMARKIWLAGLGAYGRIAAETQGVAEKLAATAGETFEQLVSQGVAVEDKVRASMAKSHPVETVTQVMETAATKAKSFTEESRAALEASFGKIREAMAGTLAPWSPSGQTQLVEALKEKVEALTLEVEALTLEVEALKAGVDKA